MSRLVWSIQASHWCLVLSWSYQKEVPVAQEEMHTEDSQFTMIGSGFHSNVVLQRWLQIRNLKIQSTLYQMKQQFCYEQCKFSSLPFPTTCTYTYIHILINDLLHISNSSFNNTSWVWMWLLDKECSFSYSVYHIYVQFIVDIRVIVVLAGCQAWNVHHL